MSAEFHFVSAAPCRGCGFLRSTRGPAPSPSALYIHSFCSILTNFTTCVITSTKLSLTSFSTTNILRNHICKLNGVKKPNYLNIQRAHWFKLEIRQFTLKGTVYNLIGSILLYFFQSAIRSRASVMKYSKKEHNFNTKVFLYLQNPAAVVVYVGNIIF